MEGMNGNTQTLCRRGYVSTGSWIILAIAVVTLVLVSTRSATRQSGLSVWTSSREHMTLYRLAAEAIRAEGGAPIQIDLFSADVLSRRMMSGFLSRTPVADCIEVERSLIGPVFAGPI